MLGQTISTPIGWLHAIWGPQGKLQSCSFADPQSLGELAEWSSRGEQPYAATDPWGAPQQLLADRLQDYFTTGLLPWDLESLDWQAITPFQQSVLRGCYEIPPGETRSYASLAVQAGSPRAARAVGSAMARNRWPLLIPCHRVVGARGELTGYSGVGGIKTKRWLLDLESQHATLCS